MDLLSNYYKFDGKLSLVELSNALDLVTNELKAKVRTSTSKAESHLEKLVECIKSIKEDGPFDLEIIESVKQLNLLINKAESDHSQLDKLEPLEDYRNKLADANEILALFSNWDDLISKIRGILAVKESEDPENDQDLNEASSLANFTDSDLTNLILLSTLFSNISQIYRKARRFVAKKVLANISTIYQGYYTLYLAKLSICIEKILEDTTLPIDPTQFRSLYFGDNDEYGKELGFFESPQSLMKSHILKTFKRIFHEYLLGLLSSLSDDPDFSHISSMDGYRNASFIVTTFVKFMNIYIEERKHIIEGLTQSTHIYLHIINSGLSELSVVYLMLQSTISIPTESIEDLLFAYDKSLSDIIELFSISYYDLSSFLPESVFTKYINILSSTIKKVVEIDTSMIEDTSDLKKAEHYKVVLDSLNKFSIHCVKLGESEMDEKYTKLPEFQAKIPNFASNLFRHILYHSFVSEYTKYFKLLIDRGFEKSFTIFESIEYLTLLGTIKNNLVKTLNSILAFTKLPFEFLPRYYILNAQNEQHNGFEAGNYPIQLDSLNSLIDNIQLSIINDSILPLSKNLKEYQTLPQFRDNKPGKATQIPSRIVTLAAESFISLVPFLTGASFPELPKLVFNGSVELLIEHAKKIDKLSKTGAIQLLTDLKHFAHTGIAFELENKGLNSLIEIVECAVNGQAYNDPWLLRLTCDW